MTHPDSFRSRATLDVDGRAYTIYRLDALRSVQGATADRLPFSLKVLLENLLRNEDGRFVKRADIESLASWDVAHPPEREIAFRTSRVLLQDFTGVPAVVDLAAMRDAITALGGDAGRINPLQPVDLVIDHSVQVDEYGSDAAFLINAGLEFDRNQERYAFLRWGQTAFKNFRVVPPDTGIVHQVNLEYLASVVCTRQEDGATLAYPDSLVGTDSHTTMINGLGVVGWGVGGIEAEAAMLGQPLSMLVPEVVGFKLRGQLPPGATATDLVLTVTQMLRQKKVVGKFVEFYGAGLSNLSLADRATIANMAPEYGATMGFFPVDAETLAYMTLTARDPHLVRLTEAYTRAQGLFRSDTTPDPVFADTVTLDLSTVEPSLAGPKRPQDRVPLSRAKPMFREALSAELLKLAAPSPVTQPRPAAAMAAPPDVVRAVMAEDTEGGAQPQHEPPGISCELNGHEFVLRHGAVVIAAITSCTNTSNPSVMMASGMLARNAVRAGLVTKPWVKTSLAPGSKVVTDYLRAAGVLGDLSALGFNVVGYGCTTCIGNSGPLPPAIADAIEQGKLVAAAVLSGNRNFEGRVNPLTRFNYLASPPLVVAYALAGRMDIDLGTEPLGIGAKGPVFLRDIWPSSRDVEEEVTRSVQRGMFHQQYGNVFEGDDRWRGLAVPTGDRYAWAADSTYVKNPPYFEGMTRTPPGIIPVVGARVLAMLGGARRGNHEVMVRGTFANIRLRNELAPGTEGGWTRTDASGQAVSIYDAAMAYQGAGTPLIVIAGKEYGTGSSRDWAAKGTRLLGVRAVIAESFERIHRSNLVGMGVLPLEFADGATRQSLGLTGFETYEIDGLTAGLTPRSRLTVRARSGAREISFAAVLRIDTPEELAYYRHGGILPYVLRQLVGE
jgi:aconitate hydratase